MSWYARTGPRHKPSSKFQSYSTFGTQHAQGDHYRGWHYSFVSHQTGSGVQRTKYAVSITDPHQNRVAYLRDFSNVQQATDAAKRWIDEKLGSNMACQVPKSVGAIPTLPEFVAARKELA